MARYWQPKHKCKCTSCGWEGKRTKRMMFKKCPRCDHYPVKQLTADIEDIDDE